MSGNGNGNGNGNGAARDAGAALAQLTRLAAVLGPVVLAVWGVATWSRSIETGWQQPVAQVQQVVDGLRAVTEAQGRTLETVVEFMNAQTMARRASGARERQRKELCQAGALQGDRCLFLPSEAELEALER